MTTRARTVGSDNSFSEKIYPSHSDSYRQVIPDQYTTAVHSGNYFPEKRYPSQPESCRQVIPDQYIDQRKLQDLLENLFPRTDDKPKYMTKWKPGRWVISAPERLSQDQIRELKL